MIASCFATINQEEFTKTAALFTEEGELKAPFEKPIIGPILKVDAVYIYTLNP